MAKKNSELELLSSEYCHVPNQCRLLSLPSFVLCAAMQLKTCKKPEENLNMRDATTCVTLAQRVVKETSSASSVTAGFHYSTEPYLP